MKQAKYEKRNSYITLNNDNCIVTVASCALDEPVNKCVKSKPDKLNSIITP